MSRESPRRRREISARRARLLPFIGFRYSLGREAYVLRIVGNQFGPVFKVKTARARPASVTVTKKPAAEQTSTASSRPITGAARNRPITGGTSPAPAESLAAVDGGRDQPPELTGHT